MSNDNVTITLNSKFLWPILAFILGISGGSIGGFLGGEGFVSHEGHVDTLKRIIEEKCGPR